MTAAALLYVTVSMSHEVVASNLNAADILKWHVEKAVRGIPDRVYAVDQRIVRCAALPPWDLWDVRQGGSHVDPLAMDLYSIRLYTTRLEAIDGPERTWAQGYIDGIPEGAMLPPDYAAWVSSLPSRPDMRSLYHQPASVAMAVDQMERAKQAQAMLDSRIISKEKAAQVIGMTPAQLIDAILAKKDKP